MFDSQNRIKLFLLFVLFPILFAACNNNSEKKSENSGGNGNGDDVSLINGTDADLQITFDSLPEVDFEGADFVIGNIEGWVWIDVTLDVEAEETGEVLNEAIYNRNRAVEEKYNINIQIVPIEGESMGSRARTLMQAGDCNLDIMQTPTRVAAPITVDNLVADANKLNSIDFAHPWWDDFAHASTSIIGKNFFLYGDFTIADKEYATAIFFNKEMQAIYALPNYYDIVRAGDWTIDIMLESMRAATSDLDGDGKWTKDDQYGLVTNIHSQAMLFYGAGETIVRKDNNDMPYWAVTDESYLNAFFKMAEFMNTDNTTAEAFKLGSHQDDMFAEGKALFDSSLLAAMRAPQGAQRGMEYDFGILPPPKLSTQQERYYSFYDGSTPCIVILNHEQERVNRSAVILEALNAKSSEDVKRRYMELALPAKYFRDEESFEMLEIILQNRIFDMSAIYCWGNFESGLRDLLGNNKIDQVSSFIEKNLDRSVAVMEKDLEQLLVLE